MKPGEYILIRSDTGALFGRVVSADSSEVVIDNTYGVYIPDGCSLHDFRDGKLPIDMRNPLKPLRWRFGTGSLSHILTLSRPFAAKVLLKIRQMRNESRIK